MGEIEPFLHVDQCVNQCLRVRSSPSAATDSMESVRTWLKARETIVNPKEASFIDHTKNLVPVGAIYRSSLRKRLEKLSAFRSSIHFRRDGGGKHKLPFSEVHNARTIHHSDNVLTPS